MNINEEYAKLFGTAQKVDLFDPEEDYYNGLRLEIISAKSRVMPRRRNPFNDIQLQPYPLYALEQVEKKAIEDGRHLFYLSHSTYDAFDYCYAIGFFLQTNHHFYLLPYSHISSFGIRNGLRQGTKLKRYGEHWYLRKQKCFLSIEAATEFVLGSSSETGVWKDSMEKSFYDCYPRTVSDFLMLHKEKAFKNPLEPTKVDVHLFYITDERNGIKATGYYEPTTNFFYITKGSIFSARISSILMDEDTINARNRFISEACVNNKEGCHVKKDTKCRNPSAAATIVLGRRVNGWLAWKDSKGCSLKDIYKK